MSTHFLVTTILLLASALSLHAQMPPTPASQDTATQAGEAATVRTERQKRLNDQALRLSLLGRQIHESIANMKSGEISAVAIKQIRELEKLADTMSHDTAN